jgi:hypothetical protein
MPGERLGGCDGHHSKSVLPGKMCPLFERDGGKADAELYEYTALADHRLRSSGDASTSAQNTLYFERGA